MRMLRGNEGFTLIELVVVIVILGILSVIAVPKYLDIRVQAEEGTAHGVTAALRGAIAIRHARYLMDSSQTYNGTIIAASIETEDITVTGAASTITAAFASGNNYTWVYTVQNGDTPAKVAEGF